MGRKKTKEYYAVLEGHGLAQPTIYSSWAKTHVRTTGYKHNREVLFKGFSNLQEAETFMRKELCGGHYELDVKSEHEQTTPERNTAPYYAVASGQVPDIYHKYDSINGAEKQVSKKHHNCHQKFRTEEQAKEFMEDWCKEYLEVLVAMTTEKLKAGWRPLSSDFALPDGSLLPPASSSEHRVTKIADTMAYPSV